MGDANNVRRASLRLVTINVMFSPDTIDVCFFDVIGSGVEDGAEILRDDRGRRRDHTAFDFLDAG